MYPHHLNSGSVNCDPSPTPLGVSGLAARVRLPECCTGQRCVLGWWGCPCGRNTWVVWWWDESAWMIWSRLPVWSTPLPLHCPTSNRPHPLHVICAGILWQYWWLLPFRVYWYDNSTVLLTNGHWCCSRPVAHTHLCRDASVYSIILVLYVRSTILGKLLRKPNKPADGRPNVFVQGAKSPPWDKPESQPAARHKLCHVLNGANHPVEVQSWHSCC